MLSTVLVVAGALAGSTVAQTSVMASSAAMGSSSLSMPPAGATSYPINIPSIPLATKQQWCMAQQNTCYQLCTPGGPSTSSCDASTLSYNCTCNSVATPNLANYNQTIPFYECQYYIGVCVNSTMDASVQRQCLARQCGGLVASAANTSSSSSSSMSGMTSTMAASSSANTAGASSTSRAAAAVVTAAQNYGLGAVIGGVALLGFAL